MGRWVRVGFLSLVLLCVPWDVGFSQGRARAYVAWTYSQTHQAEITAFLVYRSEGKKPWLQVAAVSPALRSYTDMDVRGRRVYCYKLRVTNNVIASGDSNVACKSL